MLSPKSSPHILVFAFILSVATLLLLNSCAAVSSPTSIPPTVQPVPTTSQISLGDDILVIYRKTGGIAGIDETLTVHQGGLVEWKPRNGKPKSLQVTEPGLLQIRNLLEQKDFGELQPSYQATGADLFTYTITANDSHGNPKTVTAMDGAQKPDFLGLLIVMLDNLRSTVAKNG